MSAKLLSRIRQIAPSVIAFTLLVVLSMACSFSQFAQSENVPERIDDYRTGCVLDSDKLLSEYLQYDANEFHFTGPTPTPGPASDSDLLAQRMLVEVWEHGCQTGRKDVTDPETADWLLLKDRLDVLNSKINERLTPTPVPTP